MINKVIKEYCNDSFEENVAILKEVDKSLDAWTIGRSMSRGHFEELILKKINISENIPKEYQDDAIFLDNVILFLSENYNNLNPNKLFEIIISNLNINGNELAFKKLKVMFINELKSKFDGIIIFDIGNFLDFMLFFRRVASSEKIMYSKVNIDEEINIPIECLDLSEYEKFFESILTDDSFDISNISNQKMLVTKFAKFVKKTPPILDNVILSEQKYIANELYNFLKIISDRKKFNIYKEELLKLGIDENELEFLDRINSIMAQDDIKDGKINERNKRCLLYLVFSYKYIEKKLKKISHVKKEFHK